MEKVIRSVFYIGPLIFGFGFLTPLIAQIIVAVGWTPPFGLSALATGLIVGGALGVIAQIRGRWV
ncbi:MAG: hypothetical protein QNI84_02580 [Henriciella sp.]|nr:hypothetical protein [Henriciella sp.]